MYFGEFRNLPPRGILVEGGCSFLIGGDVGEVALGEYDWHSDRITRVTIVTKSYRNTQNVRRFFIARCGPAFKFDRNFMAWLKDGRPKTMGDAVDEWLRRSRKSMR